ncbi:MAG: 50S ribosomal protein L6 [Crocinitomicaceae bacterium]|nr:50S ribosomal protein L6 [Crocinitomicaceae bacterium]
MSRVGNAPVKVPAGVEVKIDASVITIKGAKGELSQEYDPAITIKHEGEEIIFTRESDHKDHRSKHGLYRALVQNMVLGVSEGWKRELELHGVGFRANATGQMLELVIGYSHAVAIALPEDIKVSANTEKGKAPVVTLESHDKQLIGQVAAKIRALRKPEPYKGKGIRYKDEYIRRKAGKSAAK